MVCQHGAALAAQRVRREHGSPPRDVDAMMRWAWAELGIDSEWSAELPAGMHGVCYPMHHLGYRGRVLLSERAPWPRATLAHELAHLVLGGYMGFSLATDEWRTAIGERQANEFAAFLLLDLGEVAEMALAHVPREMMCAQLGAPVELLAARMRVAADLERWLPVQLPPLAGDCDARRFCQAVARALRG